MTRLRIAPAIVFVFAVALVVSTTGLLAPHLSAQAPRLQLTENHVLALPASGQDIDIFLPEYQP